jgi:uncharacterized lipoprotein YmbA
MAAGSITACGAYADRTANMWLTACAVCVTGTTYMLPVFQGHSTRQMPKIEADELRLCKVSVIVSIRLCFSNFHRRPRFALPRQYDAAR